MGAANIAKYTLAAVAILSLIPSITVAQTDIPWRSSPRTAHFCTRRIRLRLIRLNDLQAQKLLEELKAF
jgi:hypothetical protein